MVLKIIVLLFFFHSEIQIDRYNKRKIETTINHSHTVSSHIYIFSNKRIHTRYISFPPTSFIIHHVSNKNIITRKVASGILTRLSFKSQVLNHYNNINFYPKSAPGSSAKPALCASD